MEGLVHIEKILSEENVEVLTVRWNFDDTLLAVGCSDNSVRVFNDQGLVSELQCSRGTGYPVTSLRWKPAGGKTKNILLACTSDGRYYQFHGPTGRMMHNECLEHRQILASDYSPDSAFFALGCDDSHIRVIDDCTKTIVSTFGPQQGYIAGHISRVYAIKWSQPSVLISAGWDDKVIVWDIRSQRIQRVILGPHICGDALDIKDNIILTGSYFKKDQVQLWSLESGQNIHTSSLNAQGKTCLVYTAQFSKQQNCFIIGGSGSDEAYFFMNNPVRPLAILENFTRPVYSVDFCNTNNKVAVGCGDGSTVLCSIDLTNYPIT